MVTLNPPKPIYSKNCLASGTITAATSTTITDSNATFVSSALVGAYVTVISSSNAYAEQTAKITVNTGTVITTAAWGTTPSVGDAYYVYESTTLQFNNAFGSSAALADGEANPTISAVQAFPSQFNGTTWDRQRNYIQARQTGSTNTQLQAALAIFNTQNISIIVQASGGNFASQNMTVEVSVDGTNWVTVDSVSLGTGTTAAVQYSPTQKGVTVAVNPGNFPNLRITIPALGVGISAILTLSAK